MLPDLSKYSRRVLVMVSVMRRRSGPVFVVEMGEGRSPS